MKQKKIISAANPKISKQTSFIENIQICFDSILTQSKTAHISKRKSQNQV